ncbi:Alpha/beta hydrolase fold-1 [Verticillium dahliae]|nr:Alpha/beta hydrolase fold-1 [Verticillium dahliae]
MSHDQKPVVLLAHGAWHRPLHYRLLITALKGQGYTVLAPPNATSGYSDSVIGKTHKDDVKRYHDDLLPYLDAGRTAIIVAHSYGGIPGTMATEGHTLAEREARGLKGGIIAIVYIACGLATQKGVSILEAGGGEWFSLQFHDVKENTLPLKLEAVATAFYNDIEDGFRDGAVALLSEQSKRPFTDVVDFLASDLEIPKIYVVCKNDNAVPFAFQQFMAQASGAEIVELDCGHSPFLREEERRQIVDLIIGVSQ